MFSPLLYIPIYKYTPDSSVFPCYTLFSLHFILSLEIHKMSSVVCQGLQSSVEPCDTRHRMSPPITIMSRPLPSPQNFSDNSDIDSDLESIKNSKKNGWNFIQALTDPSYNTKEVTDQNEKVYVHPLVKRSASALSSKSLEMCTESLGCETGSDISSDEISSFSWEREKMQLPSDEYSSLYSEKSEQQYEFSSSLSFRNNRSSYSKFTKLNSAKVGFPPPLTSISGSNGVEVRHHREGGRLIINAVAVSSCRTYFEADRSNGRLRLSLRTECSADCDCMENEKTEEVFEDVHDTGYEEEVIENEDIGELAEEKVNEDCWDEDMDGNERKFDREIGIGEFPRPSRCKEGKGMTNWGPFWVAIS
ncbi:protein FANTASTIC FOUR 2-like [Apium graveolens]|uniref:protein FANTASTIC FOUR 2-like n=1 Tax=Apium graveolens TaxID=4045 RepID=UPI003D7A49CA